MALVTTQQFGGLQPNIQGAIRGGLATRQAIQEDANRQRLREQSQSRLETRQRALGVPAVAPQDETQTQAQQRTIADDPKLANELLSTLGIVDTKQKEEAAAFASKVLAAPEGLKVGLINERVLSITARGGDATESMLLLEMPPEQLKSSMRGLETAALTALQRAELPAKQEVVELKRQALALRKSESELRAIDQRLRKETNTLKRDELKLKIDAKKTEIEQGKRDIEFNAQSALSEVDEMSGTIDRLLKGTKLESAAGVQANFPTIAGSQAADFEEMLETLGSQAFLTNIKKVTGLGALSDAEGKKLVAATGSLSIRMRDETLRREIGRIQDTLKKARSNLEKKFNIGDAGDLPDGTTEVDVTETMRVHNMTRQQVLDRLRGQ